MVLIKVLQRNNTNRMLHAQREKERQTDRETEAETERQQNFKESTYMMVGAWKV